VGTPCDETGQADLQYIFSALDILQPLLKSENFNGVVIIKSTVPPNTTKTKIIPYLRERGITAPVVNNPEFLREGFCWNDFMHPDRIVCGVEDSESENILRELYYDFKAPLVFTSLNTAEFIKYLSNNMLASMISFSNEMSMIADAVGGISVKQAFNALHMDKRWHDSSMKSYVYPGCGFGGYCLPKDLQAMIAQAKSHGLNTRILENIQDVNEFMPEYWVKKITADASENIGILGLSFKPESDDVRNSPALNIVNVLWEKGHKKIYVYDPVANENFQKICKLPVQYCKSIEEVCLNTKTIMITTACKQFKSIDKKYPDVKFIDGRYML